MADSVIKLVPSKTVVKPGEQFTVDVIIEPSSVVAGMQCDIRFNPAALRVDDVQEGNFLKQGGNVFFGMMGETGGIHNDTGIVKNIAGSILGLGLVQQSGIFCTLYCTALQSGAESSFAMEDTLLGGWDGEKATTLPFVLVIANQVAVTSLADLNGDGAVNLADMEILVASFGLTGTPGWISEDLSSNGKIDILDMIILGQSYA